jgi:hypothetical protein
MKIPLFSVAYHMEADKYIPLRSKMGGKSLYLEAIGYVGAFFSAIEKLYYRTHNQA